MLAVYVGDRLGLYRMLAADGARTSAELAAAARLSERYVRERLEQQAASGILDVDDARADAGARRYSLPPGHDEALVGDASLNCIAPIGQLVVACAKPLDAVLDAFRSGEGVAYADYGSDLHEGQARFTRPMFEALLADEWLGAVAPVRDRLLADPPARVADVACGEGHSSLAIARGYPKVRVDGIDADRASIAAARRHLAAGGLDDRVAFHLRDAADEELAGRYDLVYIHEALHDMSYPVRVLRACRAMLADGGSVIVGDERVAGRVRPSGRRRRAALLRLQHPALPARRHGRTGRRRNRHRHARRHGAHDGAEQAGFGGFEALAIENDFYRFYRLLP